MQGHYLGSQIDSRYQFYTNDQWETRLELDEAYETRKAWRFGKTL